ncbi:epidermal growth factor-like protein 7 [Pomacea canaliculata]|uniref:epidermal growth factor-like protein 7 n=1 Tax=Pomacea canaliculata TaxID=400727 RepID=UPI000D730A0C|nr:epidermal growth factor-like protein 7 [Pomacea canaliculata]XP_025084272.1 epidermal growth factor-like protein 7 [Pomacea canaliculata]XP_025084273.1 epidermal growth factor-like protein 7 [Pomacea canaliculata]XP_025084274.1 epidermal growth factor-like protein 7 [Pomacea canaliculata]
MESCFRPSWQVLVFSLLLLLLSSGGEAQNWRGNSCGRPGCRYVTRRVCAYNTWLGCCLYRTISEPQWYTEYFCCQGWRHSGDYNCNIPICEPPCQNGGTCVGPGRCNCPVGRKLESVAKAVRVLIILRNHLCCQRLGSVEVYGYRVYKHVFGSEKANKMSNRR